MGNTKDDHNNENYDEDNHLQPYLKSQSLYALKILLLLKPYVLGKLVNYFHTWWAAQEINMTINVFYLT